MNTKEKKASFYDNLRCNEWHDSADFGPSTRARYRIIIKLIKRYVLDKKKSVLDVGCGSGNLLMLLKENGFSNLHGCDFSLEAIKSTQRKLDRPFFVADLTKHDDYHGKQYDVIICSEVLEHVDDDRLALRNIRELLKPGGIAIISVPAGMQYWSAHDDFSGHTRRYEYDDLREKIEETNFEILDSFCWGSLFYSVYHRLLTGRSPKIIMGGSYKKTKKIISKILSFLFFFEVLSRNKRRARRIFFVLRKSL